MNKELLIEGIKKLGMETTEEQIERFFKILRTSEGME